MFYRYLNDTGEVQFKRSNITHLVEHPLQMRPPSKHKKKNNKHCDRESIKLIKFISFHYVWN